MKTYVAYYRVSTEGQGKSGLGLEAQRDCVKGFTKGAKVVQEFEEIESGKRAARPVLSQAIEEARRRKATLIIAKLDRLSRDVEFIFKLRNSGVDFVACDVPQFDTLSVGIFAVLAQHERELISQRTKSALRALKARGKTLGTPKNLTREAQLKGAAARRRRAQEDPINQRARAFAHSLRKEGLTLAEIAARLNESGYQTVRGNRFLTGTIAYLLNNQPKGIH